MSTKILKVKNSVTGDLRRISQSSWGDLVSLDSKLRNLFKSDLPKPYVLQYRDEDGDLVSITSTIEFLEAAKSAERLNRNRPVLSLTLCKAESISSSINLNKLPMISGSQLYPKLFSSFSSSSSSSNNKNVNNNSNQNLKGKIYINTYVPNLDQSIRKLVNLSFGWIQSRDTLIQFGGNFNDSLMALQQLGARPSQNRGISRYYFSDDFAQKIRDLVDAGFPTKIAIQTLVRFGGNAQSTALELAGVFEKEEKAKHCDRCDSYLKVSKLSSGAYSTGWFCDRCRCNGSGARWKCPTCEFDVCFKCEPKPHTLHQKNQSNNSSTTTSTTSTTSTNNNKPDFSLPDSLRSTVLTLEKMGFTNRDKNIELLVKYGGDSTKVAMHLSEEVRRKEEEARRKEKFEKKRAEQERRRKQRIEAQKRLKEQERLRRIQLEQEKNRGEAAKLMIKSPEKIATDIHRLQEMGYDTISATTSLLNAGGDIESALEELLKLQ